jgi:hypothetical protein
VKVAFDAGERPPDPFPITELSGTHQKPNIQELDGVLALRHIMHCVKHNIVRWEVERFTECGATEQELADDTAFMRSTNGKLQWDTNVYRALYRNVLIGAVLSRALVEPMVSSIETENPFAKSLVKREPQMERQHLHYLAGFPAYSRDPEHYGQVLKPLADWMAREGWARNQGDEAMVREMLHILAAYEHLKDKIVNGYNHDARGKREYLGRHDITRSTSAGPYIYPSGQKKITVALFGIFQLEDISLPIEVMDTTNRTLLVANPCHGLASRFPFWPCLKYPIRNSDYTLPGPALYFFEFVLEYLGWRFTDKAFSAWDDDQEDPQEDLPYHSISRLFMFCDGQLDDRLVERIG